MRLTDSKRMRDADSTAIHVYGVPSTWLMTNAAKHVANAALGMLGENKSAVIFCGSGNNGGDGVAASACLKRAGIKTRTLLVGAREKMTADTQEMERRLMEMGGTLESFDPSEPGIAQSLDSYGVIIDAMFGIGLNSGLRGNALAALEMINASKTPVVAADIASGVHADTGRILGAAVRCDRTVAFTAAKVGHFAQPGCVMCGELEVVDIGIPRELINKCWSDNYAITGEDAILPKRAELSHKGTFGRVLIISGSQEYTGAASICAQASVRAGAGLTYLGVPRSIYEISAIKNMEAMILPLADTDGRLSMLSLPVILERLKDCDVCAVGPGLGRSPELNELVCGIIENSEVPVIVDADGLYAIKDGLGVIKKARGPVILTPHDGEYKRLGGDPDGDRVSSARDFAGTHGCVLVLKGHRTICAFPDGEVYITNNGNPGMAKGGTGDALTGILAAMLGQLPVKRAVTTGVWLHSYAGDLCAERLGEYSMTASDIIGALAQATKNMTR